MFTHLKRVLLLSLFTVASAFITASAQQDALRGHVVDALTGKNINFAHIENYSRHVTTFTDTSGFFTLQAGKGDTLVFSAIGYYYSKFIVPDSFFVSDSFNTFELMERVYELSEATIYIPGTYKQFKQDYLNLKLPETSTDVLRKELSIIAANVGKEAYEEALAKGEIEPPKAGVTILTADEKARLKLKKVIGEEERQKVIQRKYNVEIVKQVTGLEEEDEILSFMLFCDFDPDYLYEANPLDLVSDISDRFEAYQKKNVIHEMLEADDSTRYTIQ